MKLKTLFILSLVLIFNSTKASDIIVDLIPDSTLSEIGFSCLKVIDARVVKDNIGFVARGLNYKNIPIQFPEELELYLTNTINKLLPEEKESNKLVLIFRTFKVSESIGTAHQYGYFNIEIEFARQVDTLLYSLGTFNNNIRQASFTIKDTHAERILLGLKECFSQFDSTNWKNNSGILISPINEPLQYDYKAIPPLGIYMSYEQMTRKSPLNNISFNINQVHKTKKYIEYNIDFENQLNTEVVQFVSDGIDVYMKTNNTTYLKSSSYGKYIYFQGRVPITTKTDNKTYIVTGAGYGGLAFGLLFSMLSDNSNTNTTIKGAVIDTETGKLKFVTDMYLYRITKKFPGMLKDYRASKRKLVDKEEVINKLNSRY